MKGADHEALHHWLEPTGKQKNLKMQTVLKLPHFCEIEKQPTCFHNTLNNDDY